MFVLGDERDIVRLRTNIRCEQVYMYRLRLPPQDLRRRLLDYAMRIEILAAQPDWYNSVTSNCTTNLFYDRHANVPWWLKPNIFLNGFSALAMYRLGFLDKSLPYRELQARCAIRERALAAGDAADFSQQIRAARDAVALIGLSPNQRPTPICRSRTAWRGRSIATLAASRTTGPRRKNSRAGRPSARLTPGLFSRSYFFSANWLATRIVWQIWRTVSL